MIAPTIAADEPLRLLALRELQVLDTPIEDRFERITRLARRLLGVPVAGISLIDSDRQWFKSVQGLDTTQTPRDVSFCGHTIQSDDILIVPDAKADPRFSDNPLVTGEPHITFYAGCPLHAANGSPIGALCIVDRKTRRLSQEDLRSLRDLARLAEVELRDTVHAEVHRDLLAQLTNESRAAMVDPLTRLWNREGVFDLLERELERVRCGAASIAVTMIDLDHFKRVNDEHGHQAGDEVLRQVAKRMLGSLRQRDAIGRFGGEEFVGLFVAPDCQMSAVRIAQRLRQRVQDEPIEVGTQSIRVTASVGLVYLPAGTATSLEEVIKQADAALFHAKRTGRNRLVCAGEALEGEGLAQAG